jgi:hypothetical protein
LRFVSLKTGNITKYKTEMKNGVSRIAKISLTAIVFSLLSIGLSNCDVSRFYKAEIEVINTFGVPEQNCIVRLYAPCVGCIVDTLALTDRAGIATFEFPAKMVLNVQVEKGILSGEGFIQLEENETVRETILVN